MRVRKAMGGSAVLANALLVVTGGQPRLDTQLILPDFVGFRTPATIYVEYANTGNAAMEWPLLLLHATDRALLTLDGHHLAHNFWVSSVADGVGDSVHILAGGVSPGLLQPGERVRVPVYYLGLMQPWDLGDPSVEFNLTVVESNDTTAIDWASQESVLRPCGNFAGSLDADFCESRGPNWELSGQLRQHADRKRSVSRSAWPTCHRWQRAMVVRNAAGQRTESAVHVARRDGHASRRTGTTHHISPCFLAQCDRRHEQGPLGRGWGWTNGWQRLLTIETDGTVVVSDRDGRQRRFDPDSRNNRTYFSTTGDHATLTVPSVGIFVLRESDGVQTHFRSDGRIDYIEDLNGNRITASWSGTELTRLTHSAGQFVNIAHNAGRMVSLTDHDNRSVIFTYDVTGEHLISVQGIDGQTTHYTYDTGTAAATKHALSSIEYSDDTHEFFTYDFERLAGVHRPG